MPAIAAELGTRYIVEGSVQEDAGRVRIHVQLIDASTDQHVWAECFDRELAVRGPWTPEANSGGDSR